MAEIKAGAQPQADHDNLFRDTTDPTKSIRYVRDQQAADKLDSVIEALGGDSGTNQDTLQFSGVVGTTPIDLPGVAGGEIATVIISCTAQTPASKRLLFSLDNGSTYFTLTPGSMVGWEPKDIQQIKVKGSVANVAYDMLINRRAP